MRKNTQSILKLKHREKVNKFKIPPPANSVPHRNHYSLSSPQILLTLLTTRELQILEFAIDGFTNKEIAQFHFIEETTVKRHRQNIMDKVGIVGREEMRLFMRLVQRVLKNGAKSTINDGEV